MKRANLSYISKTLLLGARLPIVIVFSALIITTGYLILKLYTTTTLLVETTRSSFVQDIESKGEILDEFLSQRFNDLDSLANSSVFPSYYHSVSLGMSKEYGLFALISQIQQELDQRIESQRDSGKPVFLSGVYYELETSEALAKSNVGNLREWISPESLDELISRKSDNPKIKTECRKSGCRIFVSKAVIYDNLERGLIILELSTELLSEKVRHTDSIDEDSPYGLTNEDGVLIVGPSALIGEHVQQLFGVSSNRLAPHMMVDPRKWGPLNESSEANLFSDVLTGVNWTVFRLVPSSVFGGAPSSGVWMAWFFLFILSVILLIILVLRNMRLRTRMFKQLKYAHDELETRVQERTAALASANDELIKEARERKQAQKRLYQQAQVLSSITDSILIVSKDLQIIFANDASREIFGVAVEGQTYGKFCYEALKRESAPCDDCPVKAVLQDEKAHKAVTVYTGKDGAELWVYNHAFPYYDDSGELLGAILMSTDYSMRMEIEKALKKAKEHAEAASVSKSEFLMRMSHEIRTPMYAVLGTLDLILDSEAQIPHRDLLLNARLSAESLQGILNDILDFSKMEAHKMQIECRVFSLRSLVESVMETMSLRASEQNVELVTLYLCDVPDKVGGDDLRIRQILLNLLGNSIKFTSHGEIALTVTIDHDTSPTTFLFEVCDSGIGIEPEKLESIFNPFDQAEGFIARKYGGTGLGLAITKSLVELMGGKIWVESELGKGSCFKFTLPLDDSCSDSGGAEDCQILAEGDRILIVDDNEKSAQVLKLNLQSLGFSPIVENNPLGTSDRITEALEQNKPFDYLFLDNEMPGKDGLSVLKNLPHVEGMKIVFMSGQSQLAAIDEARKAGVSRFIAKPFRFSDILAVLTTSTELSGAEEVTEGPKPQAVTSQPADEPPAELRKILLAEDNTVNQKLIQRTLERKHFLVTAVGNGRQAVDVFRTGNFDLVLMDVQMPILDGLSATRLIRELEKNSKERIPIVAMTAHAFQETQHECAEAGMDFYLSKPISGRALVERIETILASKTKAIRNP